ncbi:hypothetical protein E2562_034901 [Oryza meyeriana var. granulata]|uniref:Uncharacterized protein n=1 Tax=Oryza meyeriana var. granulata TaxID=110450 RepID=A0A6G1E6N0_9ORYZ|nr:hypothetical protein E2562_034901 [Oryza meyeriana var. granulata]
MAFVIAATLPLLTGNIAATLLWSLLPQPARVTGSLEFLRDNWIWWDEERGHGELRRPSRDPEMLMRKGMMTLQKKYKKCFSKG